MRFFTIYRRKKMKDPVRTLRIDGIKTTITPKPDDAELAAQALLESRINRPTHGPSSEGRGVNSSAEGTLQHYKDLSEKIKAAHEADKRAAMRYVSYVEEKLKMSDVGSLRADGNSAAVADSTLYTLHSTLSNLERGLYQHQDAIDREGGDLKQRWQKCLALVIVKQYKTSASGHGPTEDERAPEQTTLPGLSEPLS